MEEKRRKTLEKRRAELQLKLDTTIKHKDSLESELTRRVAIIEELNQKVIDLTHQAANAKSDAEREIQQLKRNHVTEVKALRERLNAELEAALEEQMSRMKQAVAIARSSKPGL
jgi:predicted nuclease with TOPRIM domain